MTGEDGKALGPVPVGFTAIDPAGVERETVFLAAGDRFRLPIARHEDRKSVV